MNTVLTLLLGLTVGILVGLFGIGGGVVLVPALVYLLGYDQHLAQGTSLFILLPPIGLGALRQYWKNGQVDVRAGIDCAIGFLVGGYLGGRIAVPLPSMVLRVIFACFLILSAILLWRKSHSGSAGDPAEDPETQTCRPLLWHLALVLVASCCGVAAGIVGVGGGALLVPSLGLLFGFSQHRAQGTSLVALIPPTSLLAFLSYARAGYVRWEAGVLLIPGVFFGGILGGRQARRFDPERMRQIFAGLMIALGMWQLFTTWRP